MTAHDIMGTVAPQAQNDTLLENVDMKLDVLHNCYIFIKIMGIIGYWPF